MDPSPCPACGADLQAGNGPGGRRYLCPQCRLLVVGLPVLRTMIGEGPEAAVWLASEDTPPQGAPCPFCRNPMRAVTAPPAAPGQSSAQVTVCRGCDVVAVAADQQALLPAAAPASPAGGAGAGGGAGVGPSDAAFRCPRCGAPRQPTADNTCRYCGGALQIDPPVVFVPMPTDPGAAEPWTRPRSIWSQLTERLS